MSERVQGEFVQDRFIGEEEGNRIAEVVVFPDQAHVKRQAKVRAGQGMNRFLMEIRAFDADPDSAQATVYGQGELLSVQYKEVPAREAPQEAVQTLEERKRQLEDQRKRLVSEKEIGAKQTRFLDAVVGLAETELPKKLRTRFPEAESLKPMLTFLGESYRTISEQAHTLDQQLREVDDELAVLARKLKQISPAEKATRKAIEVLFDATEAQEIGVEVSYVAQNADWEPVYKIDVETDLSGVRLAMFARIRQKTGEQWDNVRFSVSNAIPLKGTALPDLSSWYLSLPSRQWQGFEAEEMRDEATLMAGSPQMMRKARAEGDLAEEADFSDLADALPEAVFTQAEEKELPHTFEYELPRRVSMDSGGGETLLPLYTKRTAGEFFVYAVPRNDPLAYLVCRTASDRELLAGRLNVHFGGRFVSSTTLSEKKAGEDMILNLGAERGVTFRREKVKDRLNETFFGMVDRLSVARELVYRVVIENLKDEVVRIRLLDSIPVSQSDRIQIKGLEIDPEPTEPHYQGREGVMLWDFQIKPKSTGEIYMRFFIKHPKNQPPQGV